MRVVLCLALAAVRGGEPPTVPAGPRVVGGAGAGDPVAVCDAAADERGVYGVAFATGDPDAGTLWVDCDAGGAEAAAAALCAPDEAPCAAAVTVTCTGGARGRRVARLTLNASLAVGVAAATPPLRVHVDVDAGGRASPAAAARAACLCRLRACAADAAGGDAAVAACVAVAAPVVAVAVAAWSETARAGAARRAALRTAAAEACAVARPPARLAAAPGSAVAHLLRACLARDAGVDGAVAVALAAGDFESTKVLSDATLAGLGEPTLDGHTGPARTVVVELRGAGESAVLKITSHALAARECEILKRVAGLGVAPAPLGAVVGRGWTACAMELLDDFAPLASAAPDDPGAVARALAAAVRALAAASVAHRDVNARNVLVRGRELRLVDFSWAASDDSVDAAWAWPALARHCNTPNRDGAPFAAADADARAVAAIVAHDLGLPAAASNAGFRPYRDPGRPTGSQSERPALRLDPARRAVVVGGYQRYEVTVDAEGGVVLTTGDAALHRKLALASRVLDTLVSRRLLAASWLDVGCSAGALPLLLAHAEAARLPAGAAGADADAEYVAVARGSAALVDALSGGARPPPTFHEASVSTLAATADVVSAFALVHWLWSATELYGSLAAIIDAFAARATTALLVEWVDPVDPAIAALGHVVRNGASAAGYDLPAFRAALDARCAAVEDLGAEPGRPSRHCYLCILAPPATAGPGAVSNAVVEVDL